VQFVFVNELILSKSDADFEATMAIHTTQEATNTTENRMVRTSSIIKITFQQINKINRLLFKYTQIDQNLSVR
jgi:hypothetical protein